MGERWVFGFMKYFLELFILVVEGLVLSIFGVGDCEEVLGVVRRLLLKFLVVVIFELRFFFFCMFRVYIVLVYLVLFLFLMFVILNKVWFLSFF